MTGDAEHHVVMFDAHQIDIRPAHAPERGESVEGRCAGLSARTASSTALTTLLTGLSKDPAGFAPYLVQVHTQTLKHASGNAFAFSHQAYQKMFGAYVMMIESSSLVYRKLDYFFRAGG